MQLTDNSILFRKLRHKHPEIVYEDYKISYKGDDLYIEYMFTMTGGIVFRPFIHIPASKFFFSTDIPENTLRNLVFHIGMIELISYWKTACPPTVIIKPHKLNDEQIEWWKNLYFKGMGEFFFINNIDINYRDFLNIINHKNGTNEYLLSPVNLSDGAIIPVGGGKDSSVTLKLLKNYKPYTIPMVINHRQATRQTIKSSGYNLSDVLEINRMLDQTMLDLNNQGYLNGHTPFSALLAFVSLLAGIGSKTKHIVLSNESSANEATIPCTNINHQYSKSYEFEQSFRNYVSKFICPEIKYFSFLRPLNELQIAGLFARYPEYHQVFKSCNAGSKNDIWCCECSKCLFSFIILSPFFEPAKILNIFGDNLLDNYNLKKYFDELTGISKYKPFECVGTIEEVNTALCMTISKYYHKTKKPILLEHYIKSTKYKQYFNKTDKLLSYLSDNHFLPENFYRLLKNEVCKRL